MRRLVTGFSDGKSVIVSDEELPGRDLVSYPGFNYVEVWNSPPVNTHPAPSVFVASNGELPPAGGTQLQIVTFPPDSVFASPDFDLAAAAKEQMELFPGVAKHFPKDGSGLHGTPTLDYAIVLDGQMTLFLDSGNEAQLNKGDVVVQCGAVHAWRNLSPSPTVMAFFLIGDEASD